MSDQCELGNHDSNKDPGIQKTLSGFPSQNSDTQIREGGRERSYGDKATINKANFYSLF